MDKKELEKAFLAGWGARDHLYRPANDRWNSIRDEALAEFIKKQISTEPLKGTHI